MKAIMYFLGVLIVGLMMMSCQSEPSAGTTDDPQQSSAILAEVPKCPVSLGSTIEQIKKREQDLGSTLTEEVSGAGYTKLTYTTNDSTFPVRTYMVKTQENSLTIGGIYMQPGEAVWAGANTLAPEVVKTFEAEGFFYDKRVDHDNGIHHYFLKEMGDDKQAYYLEYLILKDTFQDQSYTRFSIRYTDLVG